MSSRVFFAGLVVCLVASTAGAELRQLDEGELQAVSGQAGISFSANLNYAVNPANTKCGPSGTTAGGCGARLTFKPAGGVGYLVLDNIRGAFSFEGATLDVVGLDSAAGFAAEGAAAGTKGVKIGLTNGRFDNFQWTLAGSNQAIAGGAGFKQIDLLTYKTNGQVKLQGNLYVFATP